MMNAPPVMMVSATAARRIRVGSTLRYSATPPHTPLILRSVCERRSSRYEGICVMPLRSRIGVPSRLGDCPDRYPDIRPPTLPCPSLRCSARRFGRVTDDTGGAFGAQCVPKHGLRRSTVVEREVGPVVTSQSRLEPLRRIAAYGICLDSDGRVLLVRASATTGTPG